MERRHRTPVGGHVVVLWDVEGWSATWFVDGGSQRHFGNWERVLFWAITRSPATGVVRDTSGAERDLYAVYQEWREEEGRTRPTAEEVHGPSYEPPWQRTDVAEPRSWRLELRAAIDDAQRAPDVRLGVTWHEPAVSSAVTLVVHDGDVLPVHVEFEGPDVERWKVRLGARSERIAHDGLEVLLDSGATGVGWTWPPQPPGVARMGTPWLYPGWRLLLRAGAETEFHLRAGAWWTGPERAADPDGVLDVLVRVRMEG